MESGDTLTHPPLDPPVTPTQIQHDLSPGKETVHVVNVQSDQMSHATPLVSSQMGDMNSQDTPSLNPPHHTRHRRATRENRPEEYPESKDGTPEALSKSKSPKKLFKEYSPAQQSRIRKELHNNLMHLGGGEAGIYPLLMSYFTSHNEGKRVYANFEPAPPRSQKIEKIIPVMRAEIDKDNTKKKNFIGLLRKSTFTKNEVEDALGLTCSNDLWKRVGQEEGEEQLDGNPREKKKRKKNEDEIIPGPTDQLSQQPNEEIHSPPQTLNLNTNAESIPLQPATSDDKIPPLEDRLDQPKLNETL